MSEESTVNQFNVEGYTTIKSFIKEDEVKKFTDICLPKSSSIEKDFGTSKNKDIVYASFKNFGTRKVIRKIFTDKKIQALFKNKGFKLPFIEHAKVLAKAEGGPDTPWHQDSDFWKDRDPKKSMFTIWIALTKVTKENGCLVVPKGNVTESLPHELVRDGKERELKNSQYFMDGPTSYCELEPGDALLFSSTLPHCALPNITKSPRIALKIVFQDYELRDKSKHLDLTSVMFQKGMSGILNSIFPCSFTKLRLLKYNLATSFAKN